MQYSFGLTDSEFRVISAIGCQFLELYRKDGTQLDDMKARMTIRLGDVTREEAQKLADIINKTEAQIAINTK